MKQNTDPSPRSLPQVDVVLRLPGAAGISDRYGHNALRDAVRGVISDARAALLADGPGTVESPDPDEVLARALAMLERAEKPGMSPVINATGIILHTGLGRAVMPSAARAAVGEYTGYCNVQTDLETGERIRREHCIRDLVHDLTGAEDALLVNNNAGATMLVLRALARDREVIVSRGELIEIGGSFRLPDIMRESGALLREIGTTNKTHPRDYEAAVGPRTGLLLKAHKSNYAIVGFSKEVGIEDVAKVGKKHDIPVVDDLGCGALVGLERYGLEHETTMRESLEAGADIVLSSTDKLIGGPQGGLIVGRKDLLDKTRANPLYRTLRVCKLTLAALEATLRLFKAPEHLARNHPLYAAIAKSKEEMKQQAEDLARELRGRRPDWDVTVAEEVSHLGGGALPGTELPSFAVRISSSSTSAREAALMFRGSSPPVIPHVREEAVLINMRTVFPSQVDNILNAVPGQ